jgi:predicted dinucleotide-binding enzyme
MRGSRVGVEGTGTYGAGIARSLCEAHVEVLRNLRAARRAVKQRADVQRQIEL